MLFFAGCGIELMLSVFWFSLVGCSGFEGLECVSILDFDWC